METIQPPRNQTHWQRLDETTQQEALNVLTTIRDTFHGVLIGPGPLTRYLIDEGRHGHRTTIHLLATLTEHGLLRERTSEGKTIYWVPEHLQHPAPIRATRRVPGSEPIQPTPPAA